MKVLILDDEAAGRTAMRQLLAPYDDVSIVGEARDVATALEWTRQHRPDVAFMDVRLRGETAFDYVGQLTDPQPRLVFITAYDEYAVRGFECNALDYLLKPVLPERLAATLDRIRRHERLERQAAETGDSVFLRFDQTAQLVPWTEITHIETHGNYTRVFLLGGESALILRPLKEWFAFFPEGMFVQAHRTAIVRIQAIRSVSFTQPRQRRIQLDSGVTLPVSRYCWPNVKAALLAWHPEADRCLP